MHDGTWSHCEEQGLCLVVELVQHPGIALLLLEGMQGTGLHLTRFDLALAC